MKTRQITLAHVVLACAVFGQPRSSPAAPPAAPDSTERARALHVLNRLTYGPRPGELDRVLELGVDRFIEQQLHPADIDDSALEKRLQAFEILKLSSADLADIVRAEQRARRQARQRRADEAKMENDRRKQMARARRNPSRLRRLTAEFQQVAVVRAAMSERQLYEVMVDFWTNHFNVFMQKGADRFLTPDYIEHAIRPHALGKFEDLLVATAQSPAMLFYLDNAESVTPGSRPPELARARKRLIAGRPRPIRFGIRRQGSRNMGRTMDSARSRLNALERRLPRGINENYARELLELHTLGVDGGYTQQDIVEVARILTGWSTQPYRGAKFVFNEWAHDRGVKVALGHRFEAGGGVEEGLGLLHLLAMHPATIRHVSSKLCVRFVSDDPPSGCVDAAARAWETSAGDIRSIMTAIIRSPDFWAAENRGSKTKTPLELVVSAVRALGAEPDTTNALAQVVGRLGQPLYLFAPPTGYPETQESWINSGAMLQRFKLAMGLASGRMPGVTIDLDRVTAPTDDPDHLVRVVNAAVLGGGADHATLRVMREQVRSARNPREARVIAVGLALASPEFQRQ
ncbi:MAG: DUF1800 domain-containing protein [Gemmatimonadales bacterium]